MKCEICHRTDGTHDANCVSPEALLTGAVHAAKVIQKRFIVTFGFCGMPFYSRVPLTREVAEKLRDELKRRFGEHQVVNLLEDK